MKRFFKNRKFTFLFIAFSLVMSLELCNRALDNIIYFAKEQIINDFEELVDIIENNYPHFSTAKRKLGVDKDKLVRQYKEKLNDYPDMIELREAAMFFGNFVGEFGYIGHFLFYNGYVYKNFYNVIKNSYSQDESLIRMYEALTEEKTQITYKSLKYKDIQYTIKKIYTNKSNEKSVNLKDTTSINSNLSYKIIDDHTVYLNIKSFNHNLVEDDYKELCKFYEQIKDYENLIIDITKNEGGSDYYWMHNLVAPNITSELSSDTYSLAKSSGIYKDYANNKDFNRESEVYQYISNLPKFNKEILEEFDIAFKNSYTVKPLGTSKMFNGNIYLLVGKGVYSASEGLAMFCKNTGFATLVGSNTGGEGVGLAIREFSLTNTGLLVRFSTQYSLNQDGTSNTIYGTKPDYYSYENLSALETCLEIIENLND